MKSMTGFGRATLEVGGRQFSLVVRSVNHRFLDLRLRTPWGAGEAEVALARAVRRQLNRGRVEVTVTEQRSRGGAAGPSLDLDLLEGTGRVLHRVTEALGCDQGTASALIGQVPGLIAATDDDPDPRALSRAVTDAAQRALGRLETMRADEGDAHRRGLAEIVDNLATLVEQISDLAKDEPMVHRRRLEQRLAELLADGDVEVDPVRLAQEVAFLADRSDIGEELDRLRSHQAQMRGFLEESGPVGRKVEFLLQEFHRELNTIGSKTRQVETSHLAVEGKSLVEKMREIAANVE